MFHVEQIIQASCVMKGKEGWVFITFLFLLNREIQRVSEKPWRSAGFQSFQLNASLHETGGKTLCGVITQTPAF